MTRWWLRLSARDRRALALGAWSAVPALHVALVLRPALAQLSDLRDFRQAHARLKQPAIFRKVRVVLEELRQRITLRGFFLSRALLLLKSAVKRLTVAHKRHDVANAPDNLQQAGALTLRLCGLLRLLPLLTHRAAKSIGGHCGRVHHA
jgi:hypothetical protein